MLDKLVEITNSKAFLLNGDLVIKEVVATQRISELKITFEIQDCEAVVYNCEVSCKDIAYTTSNRLHEYKRPYNRLNLYHDHPVLWNYENFQHLALKGR
ncbi:hypothetical protein CLV98_105221 [Dyadobacter jejuensis]|uniref:Uncharacterized protein n=1 Tax=Dyadobacter jejuensis TaxID=1082580 RepID=A0A316AKB8_9BACT|nr:hypothetical protein [Dyadobacter jejuensis]PWJ58041.1 hypothetical protein CLV98_105221 [Dyadobacter jejuensis]